MPFTRFFLSPVLQGRLHTETGTSSSESPGHWSSSTWGSSAAGERGTTQGERGREGGGKRERERERGREFFVIKRLKTRMRTQHQVSMNIK
jgi:hypothetical protein